MSWYNVKLGGVALDIHSLILSSQLFFFFSVDCAAYLLYTARLNFNVVLHGLCNVDIMRLVLPVLMQLH